MVEQERQKGRDIPSITEKELAREIETEIQDRGRDKDGEGQWRQKTLTLRNSLRSQHTSLERESDPETHLA